MILQPDQLFVNRCDQREATQFVDISYFPQFSHHKTILMHHSQHARAKCAERLIQIVHNSIVASSLRMERDEIGSLLAVT